MMAVVLTENSKAMIAASNNSAWFLAAVQAEMNTLSADLQRDCNAYPSAQTNHVRSAICKVTMR
jgi:hypothetical protein